jgi:hypothetical protein
LLLGYYWTNWAKLGENGDFRKDTRQTDRQKVGVRCVVCLAGDAQPSLLLFSTLIL